MEMFCNWFTGRHAMLHHDSDDRRPCGYSSGVCTLYNY